MAFPPRRLFGWSVGASLNLEPNTAGRALVHTPPRRDVLDDSKPEASWIARLVMRADETGTRRRGRLFNLDTDALLRLRRSQHYAVIIGETAVSHRVLNELARREPHIRRLRLPEDVTQPSV
jgi:hypothetical protein